MKCVKCGRVINEGVEEFITDNKYGGSFHIKCYAVDPAIEKQWREQIAASSSTVATPTTPTIDRTALQNELARLQNELNILNTYGYQKLMEERERKAIQDRINQINKLLSV